MFWAELVHGTVMASLLLLSLATRENELLKSCEGEDVGSNFVVP